MMIKLAYVDGSWLRFKVKLASKRALPLSPAITSTAVVLPYCHNALGIVIIWQHYFGGCITLNKEKSNGYQTNQQENR